MEQLMAGAGTSPLVFPPEYFPADGFSGIHDPMHAKVLLLEQGQTRGAVVTLELPSVRPWELTDQLRNYAAELLQVPPEHLWLVMTHDLSAPHVPPSEPGRHIHMQVLRSAIAIACTQAMASRQPVTLSVHYSQCYVNSNRDMESADGWWVGIHGTGPSEKNLSLLRFDSLEGHSVAALYSYALKSSVLEGAVMSDGKRYASGDITGRAGTKAEARLGCPVLFVMGAAGEQVPRQKAAYLELDSNRHFYPVNLQEEGYPILEELSDELCDAIENAWRTPGTAVSAPTLRFSQSAFWAKGQQPYPKSLPEPPVRSYTYPPAPDEEISIWYLQLGSVVMLGLKPEIATPTFRAIQDFSPYPHTWMATLVNGGQGYIAIDSDYERFTYPGLKTPFRQGTDQLFLQEVRKNLTALAREDNPC